MAFSFGWEDALGSVGLIVLLTGFLGNLAGRIPAGTALYAWLNIIGSGLLTVYSVLIEAWVFFPLEVVWTVAAVFALLKSRKKAPGSVAATTAGAEEKA